MAGPGVGTRCGAGGAPSTDCDGGDCATAGDDAGGAACDAVADACAPIGAVDHVSSAGSANTPRSSVREPMVVLTHFPAPELCMMPAILSNRAA